jgi:hypothetical protein
MCSLNQHILQKVLFFLHAHFSIMASSSKQRARKQIENKRGKDK